MKLGFDNDLYIKKQKDKIVERIKQFNNKLYLEFGGKLFDDLHASRVLPGFDSNAKISMLKELKDDMEIIFCIGAIDIEKRKLNANLGITYEMDILRLIDKFKKLGISVNSIVVTRYTGQHNADRFLEKMKRLNIPTTVQKPIPGYPFDVNLIASDEGYGANPFIKTTKPLVIVTGPGPGSGKLATCLSQIYHEHKRGINAGYAKYETFPVWDLPLSHPVNLAYEAATADLDDINMIDTFHLDEYGIKTVNYNRDIEAFPVVKTLLSSITSEDLLYKSPTDMGVNMIGKCITDDQVIQRAANKEIIRRYFKCLCDCKLGRVQHSAVEKVQYIMNKLNLKFEDRPTYVKSIENLRIKKSPSMAIELDDGKVIVGKTTNIMSSAASVTINAIKYLAKINEDIPLLSPIILEPIIKMKKENRGKENPILSLNEVLIAISISAATNPTAAIAFSKLSELSTVDAHSTHLLSLSDEQTCLELGINFTCQPELPTSDLYFN